MGGYAVIYHGYNRSTGDIDVWVAVNPENAAKIASALKDFGFAAGVDPALFTKPGHIVRMGIPPFRIELLTTISGLKFPDAYARRLSAVIDGVELSLLALDDLRINKKASGRLKDLADLEALG